MLGNVSRRWFGGGPAKRNRAATLAEGRFDFHLEPLEDRTLLSAYVPGELLVQYTPTSDALTRNYARALVGGQLLETIHTQAMVYAGSGILERISFGPDLDVNGAMATLNGVTGVQHASPNWIYSAAFVSNDTHYLNGNLWGTYSNDLPTPVGPAGTTNVFGSQVEKVWNNGFVGSSNIHIGVIDTGVQVTHPDLSPNIWVNPFDPIDGMDNDGNGYIDDINGWDFVNNDNTVYDNSFIDDHGTHVAGTIGAKGGNGFGVAGINWNVSIISAKFLGPSGTTTNAIKSVDYMTDLKTRHGIEFPATNNSWGGGGFSPALLDAITRGANQGILFVAAAGNSNSNNDTSSFYPANYNTTTGAGYDAVISVASIDNTGAKSSFSSFGATTVDLGAPGSAIYSTVPSNSYAAFDGTSMAAPHVAGAVALYASINPGISAQEIRSALFSSVAPTTSLAGITVTGGRLDIHALIGVPAPLPTLSINDVTVTEGDGSSVFATFTVTMSKTSTSTVTVNYATADGSATAGSDYVATSGTLTFDPGQTSKTFSVEVLGDLELEINETFVIQLSGSSNATINDGTGIGTINDNEPRILNLLINDVSGNENQKTLDFTVTLTAPPINTVTVNFATVNGTAIGGNTRGADFVHKSGKLFFTTGQTTKTVSISLRDDIYFEPTETFSILLSSPTGGATIVDGTGIGTIFDNDPNPSFLITSAGQSSAAPSSPASSPQALATTTERSTGSSSTSSTQPQNDVIHAVELSGSTLTPVAIATGDQGKKGAWPIRLD